MNKKEEEKCINAIINTGYLLEYEISELLYKNKWNVINNRYYIDDISAKPREIDIVAYKVRTLEKIDMITCLIISCKKYKKRRWIFLTNKLRKNDPNVEFYPVNCWNNVKLFKRLKFNEYIKKSIKNSCNIKVEIKKLFDLDRNVFAYQEVEQGKPQNDRNIYNSIITTLKAMEYEISTLSQRKDKECVYNFIPMTIVDAEIYDYQCDKKIEVLRRKNHIKSLNRFIIKNTDKFYLIHFIQKNYFEEIIKDFTKLHEWNIQQYELLLKDYKDNFLINPIYRNLFNDEIRDDVFSFLKFVSRNVFEGIDYKLDYFNLSYNDKLLLIDINIDNKKVLKNLNSHKILKSLIKRSLKKWSRYDGDFIFYYKENLDDDDIVRWS